MTLKGEGRRENQKAVTLKGEGTRENQKAVTLKGEGTRENQKAVTLKGEGTRENQKAVTSKGEGTRENQKAVTLKGGDIRTNGGSCGKERQKALTKYFLCTNQSTNSTTFRSMNSMFILCYSRVTKTVFRRSTGDSSWLVGYCKSPTRDHNTNHRKSYHFHSRCGMRKSRGELRTEDTGEEQKKKTLKAVFS